MSTSAADRPVVRTRSLGVAYGPIVALTDVDLEVPPGTSVAIIGPNGSGKSTLLGTLSGLVRPTTGHVEVLGRPPRAARRRVAHVLQSTRANESVPLTVGEAVRIGAYGRRGALRRLTAGDRRTIEEAIDRLRIGDLRSRQLHELSGGQRQRVYVAQGLAQRAELLLLDEPITGLDLVTQETISEVVREECDAGRTAIVTTHDVGTAALADLVVVVATRLIAAGDPASVLRSEVLSEAYGGHLHELDDGGRVLDEPAPHDGHQQAGDFLR